MISPLQAANLVYGCANILGMDLLQELPQRTLIITGMRKTNDLKRGHDFIIRAFKPFGKIEEAAIAPSNRGFGKLQSQYIRMNIVFYYPSEHVYLILSSFIVLLDRLCSLC